MAAGRLKDVFFTEAFVYTLAERLQQAYPAFDRQTFTREVLSETFAEMALKEKMRHISLTLHAHLPANYPQALDVLLQVAPHFDGFDAMVFPDFVEVYGLDHWEESLTAMETFNRNASAEFAIRPFLVQDTARALTRMQQWAESDDPHLRRLASEGCRPRLPWAIGLPIFKEDPGPILPILEALKADPSEDVRRSVANNLNDIAKDHPEVVLDVCRRWRGESETVDQMIKHACRGLLKRGNPEAMRLFGFVPSEALQLKNVRLSPLSAAIGDTVQVDFDLVVEGEAEPAAGEKESQPANVRLEYAVYFVKASGIISSKVFKIREGTFAPGRHHFYKRHSFADRSTRKHYPGPHWITLIVNGEEKARLPLQLRPRW
jgi:3-methyladenine DNA glycosylase AlkC